DGKENAETIARCLNWDYLYRGERGDAMVIPFLTREGHASGYSRLKFDQPRTYKNDKGEEKSIKYESPLGQPNRLYVPPGAWPAIGTPGAELGIVEGEKKAVAGTQAGHPMVGLVGCWGWQKKREKGPDGEGQGPRDFIPDMEGIGWQGRTVPIPFDSDVV